MSNKCVHFVTCGHFRSSEKDGGHPILSAIAKKTHNTCKPHGSIFYTTGVMGDQSFTLRE